jgi:CspA family cold shock protein
MSENGGKAYKVKGVVKFFDETKGFGFIICDDYPKDVFVHKQQIEKSKCDSLKEGDKVTFVVNNGVKGNYATLISKE